MKNRDNFGFLARAWNKELQKPQNKEYLLVDNWLKLLLADPKKRLKRDVKKLRTQFKIPKLNEEKDQKQPIENMELLNLPSCSSWVLSECKNNELFF